MGLDTLQQTKVKQPTKAAKGKVNEGQPKRPRGRPRKALQEQAPPQQKPAAKRKAAAAALDEEISEPETRDPSPKRRGKPAKAARRAAPQEPLPQEDAEQVGHQATPVLAIT